MKTFGEFIRTKRLEKDFTLRGFSSMAGVDPANWNKIERDIALPPRKKEVLERIVKGLNLTKEEKEEMYDLAFIAFAPDEVRPDEDILKRLPLIFRTLRRQKPTKEECLKLFEKLKKS